MKKLEILTLIFLSSLPIFLNRRSQIVICLYFALIFNSAHAHIHIEPGTQISIKGSALVYSHDQIDESPILYIAPNAQIANTENLYISGKPLKPAEKHIAQNNSSKKVKLSPFPEKTIRKNNPKNEKVTAVKTAEFKSTPVKGSVYFTTYQQQSTVVPSNTQSSKALVGLYQDNHSLEISLLGNNKVSKIMITKKESSPFFSHTTRPPPFLSLI